MNKKIIYFIIFVLFSSIAFAAYPNATNPFDFTLCYNYDQGAGLAKEVCNQNVTFDGTLSGNALWNTTNKFGGYAISHETSTAATSFVSHGVYKPSLVDGDNLTISFWFKQNSGTSDKEFFEIKGGSTTSQFHIYTHTNNKLRLGVWKSANGLSYGTWDTTTPITTDTSTWHHMYVFSQFGGPQQVVIDGSNISGSGSIGTPFSTASSMIVGAYTGTGGPDASIDDVLVSFNKKRLNTSAILSLAFDNYNAPTLDNITITTDISPDDNVSCGAIPRDIEQNMVNVSVTWYQNISGIITLNNSYDYTFTDVTLNTSFNTTSGNGSFISVGGTNSSYLCQLTIFDSVFSKLYNLSWTSSTNTAPVMNLSNITPEIPNTNNSLLGYCNATDVNAGDTFTFYYKWYKNDTLDTQGSTTTGTTTNELVNVHNLSNTSTTKSDSWIFSCLANDNELNSSWLNSTVKIINNSVIGIMARLDQNNDTSSINLSFTDNIDFDQENVTFYTIKWFINGTENNSFENQTSIFLANVSDGDTVIVNYTANDSIQNSSWITTVNTIITNDIVAPVMSAYSVSPSAGPTNFELSVDCVDATGMVDTGNGFPKVGIVHSTEGFRVNRTLTLSVGDTYTSTYTFAESSGTYNFTFYCADGNANLAENSSTGLIFTIADEVVVAPGGGGGGGGDQVIVIGGDITFNVDPITDKITTTLGSERLIEFKIRNTHVSDINISVEIIQDNTTPETFSWMQFENGAKKIDIEIERGGGITSDSKFVRFNLLTPSDVDFGTYHGKIKITSEGVSKIYDLEIVVSDSIFAVIFDFLRSPLFSSESFCTENFTDEIEQNCVEPQTLSFTYLHLFGILLVILTSTIFFIARKKN